MKITKVSYNNRKKVFEMGTSKGDFRFPFAKTDPQPIQGNYVKEVFVDPELGNEAFTYVLQSGDAGSVHVDYVLEYNNDPEYLAELLLYRLTVAARDRLESSSVSKSEIGRSLDTSASQLARLLNPLNTRKNIVPLVSILHMLDCEVELVVRDKRDGKQLIDCIA
jgi:hypothetical protein